jgi:hypothetical protein
LTRKIQFLLSSLVMIGWFFLVSPNAHAEGEITNQVDTATATSNGTIQLTETATATIISSANTAIDQAESTTAQIKVDAAGITSTTETITATIAAGDASIVVAQSAVETATVLSSTLYNSQASLSPGYRNADCQITGSSHRISNSIIFNRKHDCP